jgi:cardiolipin hydrolase
MNTADLDQILTATLADRRVQTGEKKVLTEWTARHATDEADRAVARSRAFALARTQATGDAASLLDWLEEVIKVFSRPSALPVTAETGAAFFSPGTTCIQELLRQFNTTKQSADVCVFTITDDRITDALIRAHTRGVKVRIRTMTSRTTSARTSSGCGRPGFRARWTRATWPTCTTSSPCSTANGS